MDVTIAKDWFDYTRDIVLVVTQTLSLVGIFYIYKTFRHDHERSRRQNALDAIYRWDTTRPANAHHLRNFIDALDEGQVKSVLNSDSFLITTKQKELLECVFPTKYIDNNLTQCGNGSCQCDLFYNTSKGISKQLRQQTVTYLNALEALLQSWRFGVADREVIEDEYIYLFSQAKSTMTLKTFRTTAGGAEVFPAIYAFEEEITKRRRPQHKKSTLLGT